MSPVWVGSRQLGVGQNGIFTDGNTDPIPSGKLWNGSGSWAPPRDLGAALAWNDMRDYIGARHGVWIVPTGPASSARTFSQQVVLRNQWCAAGDCGKAAPPGTSNHGWAIAVDVATQTMAAYILRYGHLFGWSWDEGKRAGEWWHFRYVGGYTKRRLIDPLTKRERRWLDRYEDARSIAERDHILDDVASQIRRIRKSATGERNGWSKFDRKARYDTLTTWFNRKVAPTFLTAREREWKMRFYGATREDRRRILLRLRAHCDDLADLARRRGSGGWNKERRGDRYQHMSRFIAHRR